MACANSRGPGERRAVVTTHRSEVPAYLPGREELPHVGHKAVLFSGQPDSTGLRVVTTLTLTALVALLKRRHATLFPGPRGTRKRPEFQLGLIVRTSTDCAAPETPLRTRRVVVPAVLMVPEGVCSGRQARTSGNALRPAASDTAPCAKSSSWGCRYALRLSFNCPSRTEGGTERSQELQPGRFAQLPRGLRRLTCADWQTINGVRGTRSFPLPAEAVAGTPDTSTGC